MIDALLDVRETSPNAFSALRDIAVDMPAIGAAVSTLAARLDALAKRGVDVDTLILKQVMAALRWNIMTALFLGLTRLIVLTCRLSRRAAAMTR